MENGWAAGEIFLQPTTPNLAVNYEKQHIN